MCSLAQVNITEGPELNNEPDNKMNRMFPGEEGAFYAYRVRTKGKGTSYFIEKFNASKISTVFSKEVEIPTEKTKVMDIRYAGGMVYIFYRKYDKEKDLMTLYYKTVSTSGDVSSSGTELLSKKTDHYEFIDFSITENQSKSKIAVKTSYKPNKESQYKTDFILFDAKAGKIIWTKTIDKNLKKSNPWLVWSWGSTGETTGFLGFMLNDNDDIYYAYNDKFKKADKKDERYNAAVEILKSDSKKPLYVKLDLNPDYIVYDIQFSMNKQNNILIAGFFKDIIERTGRDLVDVGVFNYRINSSAGTIEGKAVKTFDKKILTNLESNPKKARSLSYKVDYIIPSGDDFYLVGEQYRVVVIQKNNNSIGGMGLGMAGAGIAGGMFSNNDYQYEYQDIIVSKINTKGEFEWISNSPLRNGITVAGYPHVFKQYFAVLSSKGLYLFYNEHPKNVERLAKPDYEPSDLKTSFYIHGTNMVYSKITPDGKVKHEVAYKNETYCFAPIQERDPNFYPPEDAEIYVDGGKDEIIIYTEDKGKGRFCKVSMK